MSALAVFVLVVGAKSYAQELFSGCLAAARVETEKARTPARDVEARRAANMANEVDRECTLTRENRNLE